MAPCFPACLLGERCLRSTRKLSAEPCATPLALHKSSVDLETRQRYEVVVPRSLSFRDTHMRGHKTCNHPYSSTL
eukprot:10843105-Prorocentrum_lima.AAC.1